MTIRKILGKTLNPDELAVVPSSFDIIGNKDRAVAIIEIPDKLKKRSRMIAKAIMTKHRSVASVLAKESARYGKYRKRRMRLIMGSKDTEVVHTENGLRFLLDPQKVYFSSRESTERMRIAEKTKKGEDVCVFFAGVGPFSITIAKKSGARVTSIELNPSAVSYHRKNNRLNKADVEIVKGDVADMARKTQKKFDRILMPLPEKSTDYVKLAAGKLKKGGICHLYCFCGESGEEEVKETVKSKTGKKLRFLDMQRVLPYGPRIWKMRLDFSVA